MQEALESKRQELQDEGMEASSFLAASDSQEVNERVSRSLEPLARIEVARQSETDPQACAALSTSLLRGAAALKEGQQDGRETLLQAAQNDSSGFVAKLLAALPEAPAATNDLTVSGIRQSFDQQLPTLAAAALTPPAEGIFGRLVTASFGRVLAAAFDLRPGAEPEATESDPSEGARQNLAKLALSARCLDAGDAAGALQTIEELTGDCGRVAQPWAQRMRQALLVQQTLRALCAKAECLNASLPHGGR